MDALAHRIAQFPAESIHACKQMVYESIDKPIDEALKAEAYWLYQATSKTPAIKRFTLADEQGLEHDMENQRTWGDLVMKVQEITCPTQAGVAPTCAAPFALSTTGEF